MVLVLFLSHVPGCFLVLGLLLPVCFLLLLMSFLNMNLQQVEVELSEVRDPQETARRLCCNQHHRYRQRYDS